MTRMASLDDVCVTTRSGFWGDPEASTNRPLEVQVVRNGDLASDGWITGSATRYFSERESELARVRVGDVLLTSSGDVGKVAMSSTGDLHVSNFVRLIRPGPSVDGRYLYFVLQSPAARLSMRANTGASTIPNLLRAFFQASIVPVIDIHDQRRLAAEVGRRLVDAKRAQVAAGAAAKSIDVLRDRMVDQLLEEQEAAAWPRVRFGDLITEPLRTGISGPELITGSMLGLSIASVRNGKLALNRTKRVVVDPRTDRIVQEGAFYIVRGNGRLNLVARGGIAPLPPAPIVFPDLLIEAIPNVSIIAKEFLALIWDSRPVRTDLESRSRTATGIYKINLANLVEVLVPLPSLEVQREVAASLGKRLAAIDGASASNYVAIEAINALPASLLRRAFEGGAA